MSGEWQEYLSLQSVAVSFGVRQILRGINARLTPGMRVVLSGPNGSGKSSLLRMALGVVPPSEGSILLFGSHPTRFSRLPHCAFVGDFGSNSEGFSLPTARPVGEFLRLRSILGDCPTQFEGVDLFSKLNPYHLAGQQIWTLSSGERKKLMFCFALAKCPLLLFADEPLDNIDRMSRKTILSSLEEYAHKNPDFSFLWISHGSDELNGLATHQWEILQGALVETRTGETAC